MAFVIKGTLVCSDLWIIKGHTGEREDRVLGWAPGVHSVTLNKCTECLCLSFLSRAESSGGCETLSRLCAPLPILRGWIAGAQVSYKMSPQRKSCENIVCTSGLCVRGRYWGPLCCSRLASLESCSEVLLGGDPLFWPGVSSRCTMIHLALGSCCAGECIFFQSSLEQLERRVQTTSLGLLWECGAE